MPVPTPPKFTHKSQAIHNFVNLLLADTLNTEHRSALIIMSGIQLSNVELIEYAVAIDPAVVNTAIPSYVEKIINGIFDDLKKENPPNPQ